VKNEFPVRLLYARKDLKKMSQGELSKLIGFHPATIWHFETGSRKPSFDSLKRLADVLEVITDLLLGRVDTLEEIKKEDNLYEDIINLSPGDKIFLEKMIEELKKKNKQNYESTFECTGQF